MLNNNKSSVFRADNEINYKLTDRDDNKIQAMPMSNILTVSEQTGFTLVELLIALVLGLLISAAALQIFYTSSVNARRQEAGSQIQDNALFGLTDLQYHLRRVNYGSRASTSGNGFFMNHLTPQGGIVLTAPDGTVKQVDSSGNITDVPGWTESNLYGLKLNGAAIDESLLSHNASANSASNIDGVASSDQLTVQYQAGRDGMYDCQGRVIPEGYYVIERYFVRTDTTVTPNQNGLACASAIYKYDETLAGGATGGIDISEFTAPGASSATTNDLAGNGLIIIPNVDYFRVLLGVSPNDNFAVKPDSAEVAYIPIPDDPTVALEAPNRRIIGMQLGLLTHSDNPTATAQNNEDLIFSVLDQKDKSLNTAAKDGPKYLRNVYESSVLFRNARGGV